MQISNESQFEIFVFESLDERDQPVDVVICRGSFKIKGNRLATAAEQKPVVLVDEYHGQPLTSSVRLDTDLVPRKHAADITLNAVVHAPQSQPTSDWPVSVRVGRITKQLRVTGPRQWKFGPLRGWHLSLPAPATEVPIRYENAFGGSYEHRG